MIEGGSYDNSSSRILSVKSAIKINIESNDYAVGKNVIDLKTIIEKKEKRKKSREREKR